MQLKKLVGQTAIYGISSIVARLINYLLTPYLTRILSPESYGVVGDMYALIPFALVLLTMGMETGYFRFAGKSQSTSEQDSIFTTTLTAVCTAALLFVGVLFALKEPIDAALRYSAHGEITAMVGAIIFMDVIAAIPMTRLRQRGQASRFVLVRVVSILVNVATTLLFFSMLPRLASSSEVFGAIYSPDFGVGYIFVANVISSLVTVAMLAPAVLRIKWSVDLALLKTMMLYSLPLLLSGILGTANEFIDRQLIKYLMDEGVAMAQLGTYAAVVRISVIMILFTQMYRFAAEPFFLSGFKKEEFKESAAAALKYYTIASLVIGLIIILFLDVFALLVGEDFRDGVYIVPVLVVSNILAGMLFNLSFWYKYTEQTRYALYITISGLVATITLNIALIPSLGYYGAALARLVCEAIMVAVSYYLNQRIFPMKYNVKTIFFYIIFAILIYILKIVINFENNFMNYTLYTIYIGIFVLVAYFKERNTLKRQR